MGGGGEGVKEVQPKRQNAKELAIRQGFGGYATSGDRLIPCRVVRMMDTV